ncbi:hypothetical protein CG434_18745 [Pantoea ananatis]|nr:hypothetical protein CG434_18745 [Pantoea ananatis]
MLIKAKSPLSGPWLYGRESTDIIPSEIFSNLAKSTWARNSETIPIRRKNSFLLISQGIARAQHTLKARLFCVLIYNNHTRWWKLVIQTVKRYQH